MMKPIRRFSKRGRVEMLRPSHTKEDKIYLTSWDVAVNSKFCTCPGFLFRGQCRHVYELLLGLTNKEIQKLTKDAQKEYDWIPTSLEAFNELTSIPNKENSRGIPLGFPVALYGFPASLKTQVGIHLGLDFALSQGVNCFFQDTEGALARFTGPQWVDIYSKRFEHQFGCTELKFLGGELVERRVHIEGDPIIYTCKVANILRILKLHGVDILYKISKPSDPKKTQSKVILDLKGFAMDVEESPIGKFITENNIGYVLYDSVSMPLTAPFAGSQQNRPPRTEATYSWLTQAHELADLFDLGMIGTVHASGNPTSFPGKPGSMQRPKVLGGVAVLHNFKMVLYLASIDTQKSRTIKKMWVERSPWREGWEGSGVETIKMTDAGVIDWKAKD